MLTILEAATLAGVTKDKCRYWLKLLDLDATKKEGKLFFPDHAADILQAMKKAVDSGLSPVAAAVEVKNLHALPVKNHAPICNQDNAADKIADLEKAVLLLAEETRNLAAQNKQLIALVEAQSVKLAALDIKLAIAAPNTKPVKVWQPAAKKPPQVSWLKRAWLELVNPVQLRAA